MIRVKGTLYVLAQLFKFDLVLCLSYKFFNCNASGRYVGERDCQHSPAYVPFTLEGGMDTTLEIIATGWKYILSASEHLAWPKTTKYE